MLILTRKPGESLYIGDNIKITIVELKGHQIRVGIEAPTELRIYREEIYLQILEENRRAAEASMSAEVGLENLSAAWSERRGGEAETPPSVETSGQAVVPTEVEGGSPRPARIGGFSSFVTSRSRGAEPQVVFKKKKNKRPDE